MNAKATVPIGTGSYGQQRLQIEQQMAVMREKGEKSYLDSYGAIYQKWRSREYDDAEASKLFKEAHDQLDQVYGQLKEIKQQALEAADKMALVASEQKVIALNKSLREQLQTAGMMPEQKAEFEVTRTLREQLEAKNRLAHTDKERAANIADEARQERESLGLVRERFAAEKAESLTEQYDSAAKAARELQQILAAGNRVSADVRRRALEDNAWLAGETARQNKQLLASIATPDQMGVNIEQFRLDVQKFQHDAKMAGWSAAEIQRGIERIASKAAGMPETKIGPNEAAVRTVGIARYDTGEAFQAIEAAVRSQAQIMDKAQEVDYLRQIAENTRDIKNGKPAEIPPPVAKAPELPPPVASLPPPAAGPIEAPPPMEVQRQEERLPFGEWFDAMARANPARTERPEVAPIELPAALPERPPAALPAEERPEPIVVSGPEDLLPEKPPPIPTLSDVIEKQ